MYTLCINVDMNLKVRLSSLGLNLDAVLLPSAMAPLMELIQQHRVPAEELTMEERHPERPGPPRPPHGPHPRFSEQPRFRAPEWAPSTQPIQQQVALLDLEGLIALARARTFPEKILALGGWITMHEQQPIIRSRQLKVLLIRLGMEPPANPGRDFRQAEEFGWIEMPDHKLYALTNAGWHKLGEMLDNGDSSGAMVMA